MLTFLKYILLDRWIWIRRTIAESEFKTSGVYTYSNWRRLDQWAQWRVYLLLQNIHYVFYCNGSVNSFRQFLGWPISEKPTIVVVFIGCENPWIYVEIITFWDYNLTLKKELPVENRPADTTNGPSVQTYYQWLLKWQYLIRRKTYNAFQLQNQHG